MCRINSTETTTVLIADLEVIEKQARNLNVALERAREENKLLLKMVGQLRAAHNQVGSPQPHTDAQPNYEDLPEEQQILGKING